MAKTSRHGRTAERCPVRSCVPRWATALEITLHNHAHAPHSVHFHGAHDVSQDGLGRVAKGEDQSYEFEAGPVGLHPYHCHIPPYARHVGKGMYGAMIVDPLQPRPAAHEILLCLCGFDIDGDGRNDVYAWNGMAGYYERYPLKVPAGELVRIYLMNMVEPDPIASFHLHAQTFDLYRSGTSASPHEHTDIVSLGPAERAILEFRLPRRGRYMFHPHQSRMAERGAMGWIVRHMMSAARAWVRAAVVGSSLAEPILWAPGTQLENDGCARSPRA